MNDNLTVISSNEDISFSIELRILKQHLAIDQNIVYMLLYLISNDEYKSGFSFSPWCELTLWSASVKTSMKYCSIYEKRYVIVFPRV